MAAPILSGLDHAILLVRDLDAAAATWQRLGFHLTARGRHLQLGTANHTIVLERDYLELLSVVARSPANQRWAAILDRGEGLSAAAWRTDDARATHNALRRAGVDAPEPIEFGRAVTLPTGTVEARFSICLLPEGAAPALPSFFCQHHTRDYVWRPEWQRHPNGAQAIAAVTVAHPDPVSLRGGWEALAGAERVAAKKDGLELHLDRVTIHLVTRDGAERRFAQRLVWGDAELPRPVGLTLRVRDLRATREYLTSTAVPYSPSEPGAIAVGPGWTHGVVLEFVAKERP